MDCEKLGQLILPLQKEKGLTQQEMAAQLNISNILIIFDFMSAQTAETF